MLYQLLKGRFKDLRRNPLASVNIMVTVHENLRLDDGNESLLLAQSGVSSQSVRVGVNAKVRGEVISDYDYTALLLDMIMPRMNGSDCFTAMQRIAPDVRVVLSSGFLGKEEIEDLLDAGLRGFLRKPYRSGALSQAVADALRSLALDQ